jgi:glycerol-3-phosphate acyltransferase PlsY
MAQTLALSIGYLVGSVPFAFLVARWRGIDLRARGSRNVGASNVLRTAGVLSGVAALVLDGVKGAAAVVIADRLTMGSAWGVAAAVASVVGHVFPVWLGFRGGKGVATAAGAFGVLAPDVVAVATVAFVLAVWVSRYISVGSMVAACALVVSTVALRGDLTLALGACAVAALVLWRHRENVVRLRAGTERRVGLRGV